MHHTLVKIPASLRPPVLAKTVAPKTVPQPVTPPPAIQQTEEQYYAEQGQIVLEKLREKQAHVQAKIDLARARYERTGSDSAEEKLERTEEWLSMLKQLESKGATGRYTYDSLANYAYDWGQYKMGKLKSVKKLERDMAKYQQQQPRETDAAYQQRLVDQMRVEGTQYLEKRPDAFGGKVVPVDIVAGESAADYNVRLKEAAANRMTAQMTTTEPSTIAFSGGQTGLQKKDMPLSMQQELDKAFAKKYSPKDKPQFSFEKLAQETGTSPTPTIFQPGYKYDQQQSELETVRTLLKKPELEKIDRRVSDRIVEELQKEGRTQLSSGLIVVTPKYAREHSVEVSYTKPWWIATGQNKESLKDELTFARDNVDLYKAPVPWITSGTFHTNVQQVQFRKEQYKLKTEAAKELEEEAAIFKADPENYPGAQGQSTEKGVVFTIPESQISQLPAQQKYQDFIQNIEGSYAAAGVRAREIRLGQTTGGDFGSRAQASARNVGLTTASILNTYIKTGVAMGGFYGGIILSSGQMLLDPTKPTPTFFGPSKFYPEGSRGRQILAMPSTPSTSDFRYTDPTTWTSAGSYLAEIPSRPEAMTQIGITTAMIVGGGMAARQAYQAELAANVKTFTYSTGKAPRALQIANMQRQASQTVFYEALSGLAPIKIQSGIIASGYERTSYIMNAAKDGKGFIDIKVKGKVLGYRSKPEIVSPKDFTSRAKGTFPDEEVFGVSGAPTEITTPFIRKSENMFVYSTIKYGGGTGAITPTITATPIVTTQTIAPFAIVSSTAATPAKEKGDLNLESYFQRKVIETTKQPFQISKYDFGFMDVKTTTIESGKLLTTVSIIPGEEYLVATDQLWTRPIAMEQKYSFINPGTGKISYVPKKGVGPVPTSKTGGELIEITSGKQPVAAIKTDLVAGGTSKIDFPDEFQEVDQFSIAGRVIEKEGIPVKGAIIPTESTSFVSTYGPNPYSEAIKGRTRFFYPESYFSGGGGRGSAPAPSTGVSGMATPASGQIDLSPTGKWISFNAPVTTAISAPQNIGPLMITQPGVSTSTLPFMIAGATATMTQAIAGTTVQAIAPISIQQTVPITTTVTTPITVQEPVVITDSVSAVTQITTPITTPVVIPITTPITTPVTISPTIPSPGGGSGEVGPRQMPPPPGIIDLDFKLPGEKEQPVNTYVGKVLVKGKYQQVTSKPQSKGAALDKIAKIVDNTVSAQGKIFKQKKKMMPSKLPKGDGYYEANKRKFRGFRMYKGRKVAAHNTIIEKKQHRIDTPGETSRMTVAQFRAREDKRALGLPVRKKKAKSKRKTPFRL